MEIELEWVSMNSFAKMIFVASLAGLSIVLPAAAEQLSVEAGTTIPLRLKGEAASVVIGNQNVADIAVHDKHLMFITGKTYGSTNIMAFDQSGRMIYDADLVVTVNSSSLVTVSRSGQLFSYDCAGTCRPVASVGDNKDYFEGVMGQEREKADMASGN